MSVSLSVIIPALNEEKTLEKVVLETGEFLKKMDFDYELIIVNDGSNDATGEIADRLSSNSQFVRAVHNPKNMGFGHAIKKGIGNSSKEWATIVTAEGEVETEDINLFVPHAQGADIVIGYISNKEVRTRMRRILSWCFRSVVRLLFGVSLPGINGMPFYRVSKVKDLDIKSDDFSIQAEILVKGHKNGLQINRFGYRIRPRLSGESKAMKPKHIWNSFKSTMRLWREIAKDNRPVP